MTTSPSTFDSAGSRRVSRRGALAALAGLAAAGASLPAFAKFPERPVRIIVPFTAGGATDVCARILAEEISKVLGTNVFVDNRDGAAGVIGVQAAAQAAPDGYTLVVAGNTLFTSHKTLYPKLPYDPSKDFVPVARLVSGSHIIIVRADSPLHSVSDLIKTAKASPGGVTYGSGGTGTSVHLAAELFQQQAGVKFLHVPYRGTSLAVTGMLSGDTQLMFDTTSSAFPRIRAGQVRALGLTSLRRDPTLPDVPTVAEQGLPKYEVLFWLGMYAPKGTPPDVAQALGNAVQTVLSRDSIKTKLAAAGAEPWFASGADLGAQIASETRLWADVLQRANIRLE